jgi:hypothetical protein
MCYESRLNKWALFTDENKMQSPAVPPPGRAFGPTSYFQLQRSGIFVEPKAKANSEPRPGAASANAFVPVLMDTKENGV